MDYKQSTREFLSEFHRDDIIAPPASPAPEIPEPNLEFERFRFVLSDEAAKMTDGQGDPIAFSLVEHMTAVADPMVAQHDANIVTVSVPTDDGHDMDAVRSEFLRIAETFGLKAELQSEPHPLELAAGLKPVPAGNYYALTR